jgi:hypothetical protein
MIKTKIKTVKKKIYKHYNISRLYLAGAAPLARTGADSSS